MCNHHHTHSQNSTALPPLRFPAVQSTSTRFNMGHVPLASWVAYVTYPPGSIFQTSITQQHEQQGRCRKWRRGNRLIKGILPKIYHQLDVSICVGGEDWGFKNLSSRPGGLVSCATLPVVAAFHLEAAQPKQTSLSPEDVFSGPLDVASALRTPPHLPILAAGAPAAAAATLALARPMHRVYMIDLPALCLALALTSFRLVEGLMAQSSSHTACIQPRVEQGRWRRAGYTTIAAAHRQHS